MTYYLYIKSHCEAPDWEQEVEAESADEAVETFYTMLRGEFDHEWIRTNMADEVDLSSDTLYNEIKTEEDYDRFVELQETEYE